MAKVGDMRVGARVGVRADYSPDCVPDCIRVVLIEPTHPGNIGAVARAMANMGFARLALVRPRDFPSAEATARAAGADAILERAVVCDDLDAAIADCGLVIGASARARSIAWPTQTPSAAMAHAVRLARAPTPTPTQVALLFGRESRGLTNRELDRCHRLVRIPAADGFPSLNLAAAVMVLLYELRVAFTKANADDATVDESDDSDEPDEPLATAEEMRNFYRHLHELLDALSFSSESRSTDKLHRKLTRLFNRAHPYAQEVRMLRGIFAAMEARLDNTKSRD